MSNEFRWVGGGYLHNVLDEINPNEGRYDLSRKLGAIYEALVPLEYISAHAEANDGGPDAFAVEILKHGQNVIDKMDDLKQYIQQSLRSSHDVINHHEREKLKGK